MQLKQKKVNNGCFVQLVTELNMQVRNMIRLSSSWVCATELVNDLLVVAKTIRETKNRHRHVGGSWSSFFIHFYFYSSLALSHILTRNQRLPGGTVSCCSR